MYGGTMVVASYQVNPVSEQAAAKGGTNRTVSMTRALSLSSNKRETEKPPA